jgi:hypothetical protein
MKKVFALNLPEICADIAASRLSQVALITKSCFRSLTWRCLAEFELALDICEATRTAAERLTQEFSPSIFLHFPVVFMSLSASLHWLAEEYRKEVFLLFCRLRTFDHMNLIEFPDSDDYGYPELPWDSSFQVSLESISIIKPSVDLKTPKIPAIDFEIKGKPNVQLRGKTATPVEKRTSALDSLGF